MKKSIIALILIFAMVTSITKSEAADNKNNKKVDIGVEVSIIEASLNIEVENIDLMTFIDERYISIDEFNELEEKGSDLLKKEKISKDDYKKERDTWFLSKMDQSLIKEIYSELEAIDLTTWTYKMLENYCKARDIYRYLTSEQLSALSDRGITKNDSLILIREYGYFSELEKKSDEELSLFLTQVYENNIKYVNEKNKKAKNDNKSSMSKLIGSVIINANAYTADMDYYEKAFVPGYGSDIFHIRTRTEVGSNYIIAGAAAQKLWDKIYLPSLSGGNVQTAYSASNLWGTYSTSKGSAHEGIDFNAKPVESSPLHAVMGTNRKGYEITPTKAASYTFGYEIKDTSNNYVSDGYTVFFMHSNTWTSASSFYNGEVVAIEAMGGTDNIHNHFSVNYGYDPEPGTYEKYHQVPVLTSDNPYIFADSHTDGTYSWDYGNGNPF